MKAVVKTRRGAGNIELLEVDKPTVNPDQVMVEVKAAGICGTDIHIHHDEFRYRPPVVLGHEFCGVVAGLGENVEGLKIGDRVTCETAAYVCGKCQYCARGKYNLCPERLGLGYDVDGAFAKYCVARKEIIHRLPNGVDFLEGALSEPLSVCTHAVVELADVTPGQFVVVTGPGPMGLLTLQVAKAIGAGDLLVTGTSVDEDRLKLAEELGAEYSVNVDNEDPVQMVKGLTDGHGADLVFECSGAAPAYRQALEMVRKAGQLVHVGIFGRPIRADLDKILFGELRVTGSFSHKWTAWEKALQLLGQGLIKTKPLITHTFPLEKWEEAFEVFESKRGLKVLLVP